MDARQRSDVPSVESRRIAALVGGLSSADTPGWQRIAGGTGSNSGRASVPAGHQGSVGSHHVDEPHGASTGPTDPWPSWARPQLQAAVSIAEHVGVDRDGRGLSAELRRRWYAAELAHDAEYDRARGPLGGMYRRAHAGSGQPICADGVSIVDRHDVIGRDGWWRTWGDDWRPTQSRATSVRVLLSPRPDTLSEFVGTLTAALLDAPIPWLLACTTDVRRLRRAAAAVLYVPDASALTPELAEQLRPTLRPATPPLCLPLAPGIAVSERPDNGMGFGEHRCHLVALGLRRPAARHEPLNAIADVFASHGIDPATPHRSAHS